MGNAKQRKCVATHWRKRLITNKKNDARKIDRVQKF